jgi:ribosomal protein S18 acetylase RimI-like enzyme
MITMSQRAPLDTLRPPEIRRATSAEIPQLAAMLARAFMDDPIASWASPPVRLRPTVLQRFHAARLAQLMRDQEIWTTGDLASVALWAAPKRWRTTLREDLGLVRSLLTPTLLPRVPLVATGLLGVERRHPPDPPHWYLAVLGTDPTAQGRGFGSAVLGPVLARCDRDGVSAYLESSKERNLAFYARHGFRVTGELRLPRGPRVWPMWREPLGGLSPSAPGRTRTCDPRIRSPTLYPAELRGHGAAGSPGQ